MSAFSHRAPSRELTLSPLLRLSVWLSIALSASASASAPVSLRPSTLELPGPPAQILTADVDRDGYLDLVAVVAYIYWDQIGIEEEIEIDEVEGIVEAMTIVPALFDRREIWMFPGHPEGGFTEALPPLTLDPSVLHLARGPGKLNVLALTDDGVSELVVDTVEPSEMQGGTESSSTLDAPATPRLSLRPFLFARSALSGVGAFLPRLDVFMDLDGDEQVDLLLPRDEHHVLYLADTLERARDESLRTGEPAAAVADRTLRLHEKEQTRIAREIPLPLAVDLDGDSQAELVVRERSGNWRTARIYRNQGGARFSEPMQPFYDWPVLMDPSTTLLFLGDLDGDGVSEVVAQQNRSDQDAGMRKSMKQAKVPPMRQRVFDLDSALLPRSQPHLTFDSIGYAGSDDPEYEEAIPVPGGFSDLDGDGRLDLVTVSLDFSLLQAVRVLATRSISIGMDFHVYCQTAEGRFRKVSGLDLSGKFKLRLEDFRIGQLSQFAGDFDGDGRRDFVQMGRGREVTIHRGRPDCTYPAAPDVTLRLDREPANLALVRIEDLDGDGLSDLLVTEPRPAAEPGLTPPVELKLSLSRGGGR